MAKLKKAPVALIITIAAIVVWQVADTAKSVFAVEQYEDFVTVQAESALRHVASSHPYDFAEPGEESLRGSTDLVSRELAEEVAARIKIAGLEVVETRISSLAYAPEIAAAMDIGVEAVESLTARGKRALTAILAAGLEGIEKALVLDEEAGDENAPRFPETLGILLQKLDQNEFAHRVFGEKFCRMYGEGKKEEWERFCAYVTDWETAEYLYRC